MAHFAELDATNTVLRVIVVANEDTADSDGVEVESIGQQFCADLVGGSWVQTSFNNNMRTRYAGIGYTYDADRDVYLTPKPYESWVLNEDTTEWEAPVPYPVENPGPDDPVYRWDEATTSWVEATE